MTTDMLTDAELDIKCLDAKLRRDELTKEGKCINGDKHGPATHGRRCHWCREVHQRGVQAVLADPNAPARPPGYKTPQRIVGELFGSGKMFLPQVVKSARVPSAELDATPPVPAARDLIEMHVQQVAKILRARLDHQFVALGPAQERWISRKGRRMTTDMLTDAELDIKCLDAKLRRDELTKEGKCINGDKHGPATHGRRCHWCREVHQRGVQAVLADPNAPARPPGYKTPQRRETVTPTL